MANESRRVKLRVDCDPRRAAPQTDAGAARQLDINADYRSSACHPTGPVARNVTIICAMFATPLAQWFARVGWCVVAMSTIPAAAFAGPFAGSITATTPQSVRIRGSDAIAGIGDWAISNGVLCAAVLGSDSEGQLIAGGGSLVDLGHCGRDDDQFIGVEPLYNFSRMEFLRVSEIRADSDQREARITTRAVEDGLLLETEIMLDLADPTRIRIRSRLERRADGRRFSSLAELLINTNNTLRNFTVNRVGPNEGFSHVDLDRSSYLEIAAAIRTISSTVLVGSDAQGPPIAYAYRVTRVERQDPDGRRTPLAHFGLNMESVSLVNVFPEPLWFDSDELGVAQALQVMWMDLDIGSSLVFEREIRVSRWSDVASLHDGASPDAVVVSGAVNEPNARLHVDRADSDATGFSPITMLRPDATGRFALRLSPGRYRARVLAPAGRSAERSFEVAATDLKLPKFELPRAARLVLPRGNPMRLVFRGVGDTPNPRFGDDLSGATIGGRPYANSLQTSDLHLAGVASDPNEIELAPGRYRVYATRGPEFSVQTAELLAHAGRTAHLEISAPVRVLETPGWISADFHVHAAPSFDSTLPQPMRVASFVAEGGEVIVSTDHDAVSNYEPTIRTMGLGGSLRSLTGVEVTSISLTTQTPHSGGHANVFPVPFDPERTRGGALRGEAVRLRELIARTRALPEPAIVQLNHPRDAFGGSDGGSYFEHLAVAGEPYDPERPIDAPPNEVLLVRDPDTGLRDVDFDAIELLNGPQLDEYPLVRRDWFSLLRQGHRITAMANSDTHGLARVAGVPRNYVKLADDRIGAFAQRDLIEAVRRGASFGTTGPLLDVRLDDTEPGGRLSGDRATLRIGVRAAPWIPVSTARVFIDGEPRFELPIDTHEPIEVDLAFQSDAFVVVEVSGEASGVYVDVLPGFRPLAFSNPIYVDANGDGTWTPPGPFGKIR